MFARVCVFVFCASDFLLCIINFQLNMNFSLIICSKCPQFLLSDSPVSVNIKNESISVNFGLKNKS